MAFLMLCYGLVTLCKVCETYLERFCKNLPVVPDVTITQSIDWSEVTSPYLDIVHEVYKPYVLDADRN